MKRLDYLHTSFASFKKTAVINIPKRKRILNEKPDTISFQSISEDELIRVDNESKSFLESEYGKYNGLKYQLTENDFYDFTQHQYTLPMHVRCHYPVTIRKFRLPKEQKQFFLKSKKPLFYPIFHRKKRISNSELTKLRQGKYWKSAKKVNRIIMTNKRSPRSNRSSKLLGLFALLNSVMINL